MIEFPLSDDLHLDVDEKNLLDTLIKLGFRYQG